MKMPEWLPDTHHPSGPEGKPRTAWIEPLLRPAARFFQIEAAGGIVLLTCALLALILANSPWSVPYREFWETELGVHVGAFKLEKTLLHWINDGLMTVFFFLIGLEIKREIVCGELREPRKAVLPVAAALGGMIAPAAIYLLLQRYGPGKQGWGIPMATDIAFVVGFLTLLGTRVPFGLKILLLTLAIVDDIGAILVIAIAYTSDTSWAFLLLGMLGLGVTRLFALMGIRSIPFYVGVGAAIWLAFVKSGIHPTVAGVVLGLLTPANPWFAKHSWAHVAEGIVKRLREDHASEDPHRHEEAAQLIAETARETVSPLDRLETALHPWVAFGIMPLFALANAGVRVELAGIADPIAVAVGMALVLGKPLGIVAFSWLAVSAGIAQLPTGVNWRTLLGAGCLAGIGFTMSLFIAGLGLEGDPLRAGKIGTLLGSALSAVLGLGILQWSLPPRPRTEETGPSPYVTIPTTSDTHF